MRSTPHPGGGIAWGHGLVLRDLQAGHRGLQGSVAVGLPTGQVDVVDAASLVPRVTSAGESRVMSLAWTADGSRLAVAREDGSVRILDGATLQPEDAGASLQISVHDIALSPDERRLAAALDDGSVHVLEWPSLVELAVLHAHAAYVRRLAWTPDSGSCQSLGNESELV